MLNYSIIIPHRNSLNLLKRALLSVPEREDIEIIVIDNSTDIIDFSSLKKSLDFKLYFSDSNKGAGHARNVGLEAASGKWTLFLDADDFFTDNAFDYFDKYITKSYEIVYFNCTSISEKTKKIANRHTYYSQLVEEFTRNTNSTEDFLRYKFYSASSKLISSNLIKSNNIRFEEVVTSNDLLFSIKIGHFAKSITADMGLVYCITLNSGTLTTRKSKLDLRSRFKAGINQYHFMNEINRRDLRPYLMSKYIDSFRFGFSETLLFTGLILKNKINIFLGLSYWVKKIVRK